MGWNQAIFLNLFYFTSVCASLTRSTFCESAQTLNRGMAELGLLGSIISSVAPTAPSALEVEVFPRFPRFELLLQPADDFDMDLCIPPLLFEPKNNVENNINAL